ncbi:MAG: hypothetical protein IPP07_04495 [Holophagales bacterium]|nr:hypothetical protein [Holophagales bacterium]
MVLAVRARALLEALREQRERRLAKEFRQAAADPAFPADIAEVDRDLEAADVEAAEDLP